MNLTTHGTLLTAAVDQRELTYRLLPYSEEGRTSLGRVTASRGAVTLPTDPGAILLNLQHDRTRPVGRAVSIDDSDTGLVATFRVARTHAGDELLAEAAEGLRTGVSVELDGVRIRSGQLLAAELVGAGAVVAPAFPSAQLVAADTEPAPGDELEDDELEDDNQTPDAAPVSGDNERTDDVDDVTSLQAAAAPVTLPVSAPATTQPRDLQTVTRLLATAGRGDRSPQLMAALTDLTQTSLSEVSQTGWLAELWTQAPYVRQIVPLLNQQPLTNYKMIGWSWTTPPIGDDYLGDKGAVPSNAAATAAVELEALRWAGAHDVDRKFRDFGDESFWASYFEALTASYARWTDETAVAEIVADATVATPADYGVVSAIVAAVLKVLPYGAPTFCLMGETAFGELVERDPLAFLSGSINLPGGDGSVGGLTFRASASVGATQVVVGSRNAVTFRELSGTPIRVEAVNVANGGVDVGAFGYALTHVNAPLAVAKATRTVAP